jgi:TonB family protein
MSKFMSRLLPCCLFVAVVCGAGLAADAGRKLVHKTAPAYPAMARQYHITGMVKLEVTVSGEGKVTNTKVAAGHPMLTAAAVDAVSHWQYEPGTESVESVVVNFSQ